ncbi:precorrin-8X methylmutase [Phosphitispora fastidiosa]|uniref:precorrin-8X methylmutase n=1 Tax=Phosphitispora fastidiosa TaxID=2837202 RepID=UPI001E33B040|nr:precorrin-8X/cobalt-precorrin-8 methylmutase [Phosphitispora fastidiosa]
MEFIKDPKAIEDTSMDIIEQAVPWIRELSQGERQIVRRIVHTTGDPEIAELVKIHPDAVASGLQAMREGKTIFTDVQMLRSGISPVKLEQFGIETMCLIKDPEVAAEAKRTGKTRAMIAMAKAAPKLDGGIIAIGNAPTALFELCEMIQRGELRPALVVGTPVGFVGAKESKEVLVETPVPYITVTGTRGGSTIAVAALNALLKLA